MKTNSTLRRIVLTVIAASGLASASAQNTYLNTFDIGFAPGRFDYGGDGIQNVSFSALNAGGGGVGSGSVQLDWTWNGLASGGIAFTFDTTFPATNYSGGTLSFDLRLDSLSTAGDFNDYGYFETFVRNTDGYNSQGVGVPGGLFSKVTALDTWTHIDISLGASGSLLRALTFQDYNSVGVSERNITGPMRIYIDNLQITPIPEPSTLALLGVGSLLLVLRRRK